VTFYVHFSLKKFTISSEKNISFNNLQIIQVNYDRNYVTSLMFQERLGLASLGEEFPLFPSFDAKKTGLLNPIPMAIRCKGTEWLK
jgi:hypothetical protein